MATDGVVRRMCSMASRALKRRKPSWLSSAARSAAIDGRSRQLRQRGRHVAAHPDVFFRVQHEVGERRHHRLPVAHQHLPRGRLEPRGSGAAPRAAPRTGSRRRRACRRWPRPRAPRRGSASYISGSSNGRNAGFFDVVRAPGHRAAPARSDRACRPAKRRNVSSAPALSASVPLSASAAAATMASAGSGSGQVAAASPRRRCAPGARPAR